MKLGAKVIVRAVVSRHHESFELHYGREEGYAWKRVPLPELRCGVFVGIRNAWDGYANYEGYEEGYSFTPMGHQRVYLIAVNKQSIIRALPEDVEEATPDA